MVEVSPLFSPLKFHADDTLKALSLEISQI